VAQGSAGVSIGEALVAARRRAGLTVAQVSQRTRIHETLITAIEGDEYAACGGDFYARGHIRAIAKVVGADPGPLIQEYDVRHRAPGAVPAVSLEELLATSAPAARRAPGRRVRRAAALGLALVVVLLGAGGYRLLSGAPPAAVPPVAAQRPETYPHPGPAAASSTSRPAIRPLRAPAAPAHTYIHIHTAAPVPGSGNPRPASMVTGVQHAASSHTSTRLGSLGRSTGPVINTGPGAHNHRPPGHGHTRPDHSRGHLHR
jgi:transcriptional regulator with XRE-family HTH domain